MPVARYDGHAEWYEEAFGSSFAEEAAFLSQHIGVGAGEMCLDVACGAGRAREVMTERGYVQLGADLSGDQLRVGRDRLDMAVQCDAGALPLRAHAVPVAVGMYVHTDVEDFAAVVSEVARCLRPGGRFVYVGLHPCFIGPFVDRTSELEDEAMPLAAGYGDVAWTTLGGRPDGLWSRVGGHHKTLSALLNAFASRLTIRAVQELSAGGVVVPRNIGIVAEKV